MHQEIVDDKTTYSNNPEYTYVLRLKTITIPCELIFLSDYQKYIRFI